MYKSIQTLWIHAFWGPHSHPSCLGQTCLSPLPPSLSVSGVPPPSVLLSGCPLAAGPAPTPSSAASCHQVSPLQDRPLVESLASGDTGKLELTRPVPKALTLCHRLQPGAQVTCHLLVSCRLWRGAFLCSLPTGALISPFDITIVSMALSNLTVLRGPSCPQKKMEITATKTPLKRKIESVFPLPPVLLPPQKNISSREGTQEWREKVKGPQRALFATAVPNGIIYFCLKQHAQESWPALGVT